MEKNWVVDFIIALVVVIVTLIATFAVRNYINRKYRPDFEGNYIKETKLQTELLKKHPDL